MTAVDTGLAGEYAAIYAYGTAGVRLSGAPRDLAEALEAEHRDRRDALLDFYEDRGLEAAPAQAVYDIEPVGDAEAAQALLLDVEERLATTWRAGVASDDPDERELCLSMLMDSAKAMARWKAVLGEAAAGPWPGRPAE
jgi:hypothetical protein